MRKLVTLLYFLAAFSSRSFADGLDTWTKVSTSPYGAFNHIIYGNGMFIADSYVYPPYTNGLSYSSDGIHWTNLQVRAGIPSGLAYGNGTFVKCSWDPDDGGDSGVVYSAPDALDLTNVLIPNVHNGEYGATFGLINSNPGNGLFIVVGFSYEGSLGFTYPGNTGTLITSTDGQSWTQQNPPATGVFLDGVASSGTRFLAVGYTYNFPGSASRAFISTDGTNWSMVPTSFTASVQPLVGVSFVHNGFYATAQQIGSVPITNYFTTSGLSWTQISPPFPSIWIPLTGTNGLYVSINSTNGIYASSDATNWVLRSTGITNQLTCIAFDGQNFVAGSADGSLFRSGNIVPSLTAQAIATNSNLQITLTGGLATETYQLQVSTNLSAWTNLFAFTNLATINHYLDTNTASFPRRYYRTITQ
jgi:hypothetical protein